MWSFVMFVKLHQKNFMNFWTAPKKLDRLLGHSPENKLLEVIYRDIRGNTGKSGVTVMDC